MKKFNKYRLRLFLILCGLIQLMACAPSSSGSSGSIPRCASCRIFISTSTHNANFGTTPASAITAADNFCNADATAISLGGTYKAMLVNSARVACSTANCGGGISENINWVLYPNQTYYRADGTTVIGTTNASGIFSFPLNNSIGTVADVVWAGFAGADWTNAGNQWTSTASAYYAQINLDFFYAISSGSGPGTYAHSVYCVEQ